MLTRQTELKPCLSSELCWGFASLKGLNPDMHWCSSTTGRLYGSSRNTAGRVSKWAEANRMVNDQPKAKQHLAALDKLCFLPCEECADLKKAISAYEAKRRP